MMKRKVMAVLIMLMALAPCFPASFQTCASEPVEGFDSLVIQFHLDKDLEPHFIFSDSAEVRADDFENLFSRPGLGGITLSEVRNGRLYNDGELYVHWQAEPYVPMDKLMIEMPTPLRLSGQDELDWYALVGDGVLLGGKDGYGPANAVTLYDRNLVGHVDDDIKTVQVQLWTDDITGKKAGSYLGSLVLKVIGES